MKPCPIRLACLAAAWLAAWPAGAPADVLVLSNGERRNGIVEDVPGQPDLIALTDAGGKVTVNRSRVAQIIHEPKPVSLCAIGDQYYERGLYEDALGYYRNAEQLDANTPKVKERIQAAEAELQRAANDKRKQRVLKIAENLRAARGAMETKDFARADQLLTQAESLVPDPAQAEELRNLRIKMLLEWGSERLDKLDSAGAGEKFEAVRRLAPQNPQALEELIKLWQDDRSKSAQLEALLNAKLADNPNDQTTRKRLADLAFRDRQYEKALPLYSRLYDSGDFKNSEVETRLQTVYESLRNEAAAKGDLEKAIDYQKQLAERFPSAADPSLLDRYNFLLRKSRIAPDDEKGWLELAKWTQERQMDSDALQLFDKVLTLNPKNEEAQRAYEAYATQRLLEAREAFNNQQYILARTLFDQVAKDYPRAATQVNEAAMWSDQCIQRINAQKKADTETARDLVKEADSYYERAQASQNQLVESGFQVRQAPMVANPRRDAIKYYSFAIVDYQQALALAPGMSEASTVRIKLQDAQQMMQRLQHPIDYGLPRVSGGVHVGP
ncbi:MAG: hypothetical protein NTW86_24475 [Candidatus Sumerlaeota bacterium]|nr:hypothetical protein [Candidatus Sumerlaeota bacterium]